MSDRPVSLTDEQISKLGPEIVFLSAIDPELDRAWERVRAITGNERCDDPRSGEVWQYHGTCKGQHTFRHRAYPWRLFLAPAAPLAAHYEARSTHPTDPTRCFYGADWRATAVDADPRAADGPRVYLHIHQTLDSMGGSR